MTMLEVEKLMCCHRFLENQWFSDLYYGVVEGVPLRDYPRKKGVLVVLLGNYVSLEPHIVCESCHSLSWCYILIKGNNYMPMHHFMKQVNPV